MTEDGNYGTAESDLSGESLVPFISESLVLLKQNEKSTVLQGGASVHEIVDIKGGFAFKSNTFDKKGNYGIATIKNVQDGQFISKCDNYIDEFPEKMPAHCVLSEGDILLSLTGNIGRVCLVYGNGLLLNQRVAKLIPKDMGNSALVYFMYKQQGFRTRLEQISTGVAQQNLSPIDMGKLKVVRPPNGILGMYAECCNPMLEEIVVLSRKNLILQTIRSILLPKFISGEINVENIAIDIRDINDR